MALKSRYELAVAEATLGRRIERIIAACLTMRDPRERTILHEGRRYAWYAGPFTDVFEAHDYLNAMVARGEITEAAADAATITGNSIFLRVDD